MYQTIDVTANAGQLEPMGSKPKFWFEHAEWGFCLFKMARPDSGEDWSEKVAERLAQRLGIPHARYELAVWRGEYGIVTPRITGQDEDLVHGNEILIELDRDYKAGNAGYRTPLHTVGAVVNALQTREVGPPTGWELPSQVGSSADVFAGYMLLDALIGNTDRHHENWAAIKVPPNGAAAASLSLAPSFDHASSMGRNEPLAKMTERLTTTDAGFSVEAYAARARSALYSDPGDPKPLAPIGAFGEAARLCPAAAKAWCEQLNSIDEQVMGDIVASVPDERMPKEAKEFVLRMLSYNRSELVSLCQSL